MEIFEIYNQGDMETDFYLGDPQSPAISGSTADDFNTLMASTYADNPQNYHLV
jgi:hypothetical protein